MSYSEVVAFAPRPKAWASSTDNNWGAMGISSAYALLLHCFLCGSSSHLLAFRPASEHLHIFQLVTCNMVVNGGSGTRDSGAPGMCSQCSQCSSKRGEQTHSIDMRPETSQNISERASRTGLRAGLCSLQEVSERSSSENQGTPSFFASSKDLLLVEEGHHS